MAVKCSYGQYGSVMVTTVVDDGNGGFMEQQLPQCVDCPIGTYSSDKGATQCTTCPQHSTTMTSGSTRSEDCLGTVLADQ